MEDFKRELNELLARYPDLPEISIRIRPRLTLEVESVPKLHQGVTPRDPGMRHDAAMTPVVYTPEDPIIAQAAGIAARIASIQPPR